MGCVPSKLAPEKNNVRMQKSNVSSANNRATQPTEKEKLYELCKKIESEKNHQNYPNWNKNDCYYCSFAFVNGTTRHGLSDPIKKLHAQSDPNVDGLDCTMQIPLWDKAFGDRGWRWVAPERENCHREAGKNNPATEGIELVIVPHKQRNLWDSLNNIIPNHRFSFSYTRGNPLGAHNIAGFKDKMGEVTLFDPQQGRMIESKDIANYMEENKVEAFSIMEPVENEADAQPPYQQAKAPSPSLMAQAGRDPNRL